MKLILSTGAMLLMSSVALASVQVNNCWGNSGGCKQGGGQTTKVKGGRRSLQALFQRDPDFEFAMGVLARNADSAEKTVDQIVADIKKGTVDQSIVQAALTKGLIVKVAGHKRSAEAAGGKAAAGGHAAAAGGQQPAGGHPSHISGPKGEPHAADNIAQHILTDGYIPPKIQAALIASKHYLAPGQHPSNPTGAPKGTAAAGGRSQAGTGAAATKQHVAMGGKSPRDLVEDSLYARDIIPSSSFSLYAREAEAEAEAYAYAAAEAKFSMDDMRNLVHATETNPIAEKAVYNALTMDPNVERVSEGLVRDWVNGNGNNGGDSEKRDVYDEYYY